MEHQELSKNALGKLDHIFVSNAQKIFEIMQPLDYREIRVDFSGAGDSQDELFYSFPEEPQDGFGATLEDKKDADNILKLCDNVIGYFDGSYENDNGGGGWFKLSYSQDGKKVNIEFYSFYIKETCLPNEPEPLTIEGKSKEFIDYILKIRKENKVPSSFDLFFMDADSCYFKKSDDSECIEICISSDTGKMNEFYEYNFKKFSKGDIEEYLPFSMTINLENLKRSTYVSFSYERSISENIRFNKSVVL